MIMYAPHIVKLLPMPIHAAVSRRDPGMNNQTIQPVAAGAREPADFPSPRVHIGSHLATLANVSNNRPIVLNYPTESATMTIKRAITRQPRGGHEARLIDCGRGT
jgi:hypothetical protein